jgi:hypothetical protein
VAKYEDDTPRTSKVMIKVVLQMATATNNVTMLLFFSSKK